MNEKLKQMEQLTKSGTLIDDKFSNLPIEKDQLLKCFELFIECKQNNTNDRQIENAESPNSHTHSPSSKAKDLAIIQKQKEDCTELANKPITSIREVLNVDTIPLKPKKVDFNALVEQQLAKGNYRASLTQPNKETKEKPKPKSIDKYKSSLSKEILRYKNHSDTFKIKPEPNKNEEEDSDRLYFETKKVPFPTKAETVANNYVFDAEPSHHNKEKKESIDDKKPQKENMRKTIVDSRECKAEENNDSPQEEYYLGFNTANKVKGVIADNKIFGKSNLNQEKVPKVICSFKGKDIFPEGEEKRDSEDEILEQIVNQQNLRLKNTQLSKSTKTAKDQNKKNKHQSKSKERDQSNSRNDPIQDEAPGNDNKELNDEDFESPIDQQEKDEDDRDFEEFFSGENNIYSNTIVSSDLKEPNHKITSKPSKIMSKYFKDILNAQQPLKNQTIQSSKNSTIETKTRKMPKPTHKAKPRSILKLKETVNELVKEKYEELNQHKEKVDKENKRINELKKEYDRYMMKLKTESEEHQKQKDNDHVQFEKQKEEEIKRLENKRRIRLQNTNILPSFPNKQEREAIDNLKEVIMKYQEDTKQKEQKNKLTIERLKQQLEEAQKKREGLVNEIKLYEEMKNQISHPIVEQNASPPNIQASSEISNNNPDKDCYTDYKTKDKTVNENIDLEFLIVYHDPKLNSDVKLIQEEMTPDGKIIRIYNTKKEVIFPSGMKKEIHEDGYQLTFFPNKDIKQLYPNGKEVYLFATNSTIQIKWPDGVQAFKFSNGSIEQVFPDGTKMISYPNGTKNVIFPSANNQIE